MENIVCTIWKKKLSCVAVTLLTLMCFMTDGGMAEQVHEYSLKAAIVLNFARFTQWPSDVVSSTEQLELCILGDRKLAPVFRKIDGKDVNGRTLRVRFAEGVEDMASCDILFFTMGFTGMEPDIVFSALGDRPVLTVGEKPEFIGSGGMINLFNKNDRIRFEVNPGAIRKHGLNISSRLLRLAIIVDGHFTGGNQ